MSKHTVQKSVRSGTSTAKAAPVLSTKSDTSIGKEFLYMAIRAGLVTVPVSCYDKSPTSMEVFDLVHKTSELTCDPSEPPVLSVDEGCTEYQVPSSPPDYIRLDLTGLSDCVDVRLHVVSSVPVPLRKFQIPPSKVVSHKPKNTEQVFGEYNKESIANRKRYKKAQYRLREERVGRQPQRVRADKIRTARAWKSDQFDRLTGIVPQVNFGLDPKSLESLQAIASGVEVHHKLDPMVLSALADMSVAFKDMFATGNFTAGYVAETVTNAITGMSGASSRVADAIDTAMSGVMKILWIVPLLGAAYYACTRMHSFKTATAIAAIGMVLSTVLPPGLWDFIKEYWPQATTSDSASSESDDSSYTSATDDECEPQAGLFEAATLGHLISMSLTYLTIGKKDPMGLVKGMMKEMPSYSRNVDSWTKLSAFLLQVVEYFVNFVRNQFGANSINLMQSGVQSVDSWCTRVMDVLNDSHTGGDIMNPDTVHLMCALRDEGKDLTNMYRFSKDVSPILHRYLGQLDDLCRVCSAAMHSFKGGRPQPVVMALTGKPGVGKTFLCKTLTTMILKSIISQERARSLGYDFDSEVFMKGTTEFWNGYAGQKAVIMDDWGQSVPVAGGENDFIDLIRMANCWAYPLNFADVENKGKNFFKSAFLLLTTNIRNIDNCQKVIIEPDAITRRINHGYEITVSPEFAKGSELDFAKIVSYQAEHKKFPYHAWLLRKYHFGIGNEAKVVDPIPKSLQSIISEVSQSILRNQSMFEDNTSMITRMLKEAYESEVVPQGNNFFDHVKESAIKVKEVMVESVDRIYIPQLSGYRLRFTSLVEEMRKHNIELKEYVSSILSNPIVQFFMGYSATMLVISILKTLIPTVIAWFKPAVKRTKEVWNAVRKKGKIPEEVLAQTINSFQPSDFTTAQEKDDGTYEVAIKFTPAVLAKAYERLTGMKIQSNEPTKYKLPYVKVDGTRVVESDVVRQGDVYGDAMANLCSKNMYQIRVEAKQGNQTLGQILFVRGSVAIMPEHFIAMVKEGLDAENYNLTDHITLTNAFHASLSIKYTIKQFMDFQRYAAKDRDCVAVNFESLRAHRDISKNFVLESDLKHLSNIRIRIDTIEGREHYVHRIRQLAAKRHDRLQYGGGAMSQVISEGFEYTGYTKCGDCGGMASLQDFPSNCNRRILGMHVAGSETTGLGFSTIISDAILREMLSKFDVAEEYLPQCESAMTMVDAPIEGTFLGLNKSESVYGMNPFTSLLKTPLHDAWGVNPKRPAKLGPFVNKAGERISPMVEAVKGYASPLLHFDKDTVKQAAYHAFAPTRELTKEHTRRVYNFEEAVAGVEGTNINGIPRGTSPGFPHVLEGITSKRTFFGTDGEYSFDNDKAREIKVEVTRIISDARNNVRNPHYYLDFLKDELRAPEKVQAGKSRLISASPMTYVIAFRMYFLAFTSAVQDTRVRNGVAVGINHYTEWDLLAKRMKTKGKECVAGDFKGFDTSEQPQIHWAILDEINAWYDDGPENARIRSVLWLEVVHSRHFGGLEGKAEYFYQWNKSLSSGHPATSIINSFYGLILFNLTWTDIMGSAYASEFWTHVYACTYGDDNVLNIDSAVTHLYNQASITDSMLKYGMTYTNEKKDGEVTNTRGLHEISFLKRGFRYEETARKYVGPIEIESALYTAYWARSKRGLIQNVKDNIEFSWLELALHEPEVWDKYAPTMRTIYKERMGLEPKQYFSRDRYLSAALTLVPIWDK